MDNQTTIKARLFNKAEFGFNYFTMINPNYKTVAMDELVVKDVIKCFKLNQLCFIVEKLLKDINARLAQNGENQIVIFE